MKKLLREFWPVILLLLISFFLCLQNYTPGTFLSGWDTLHPEFDFGLNFQRTFFGVFRVEQGLGAAAGHSHMADLPRIILLYISHFVLPISFLRYFYIFLNIIAGTLGMYFFLNRHFLKDRTASFLGALFYLLNIGTVQIFNVPFEMFTTLFATLPFIFYFASSYILDKDKHRQNLLLFAVFSLLNSPSAYAATLWYIFFLCFLMYFFLFALLHFKEDKKSLQHFLILVLITLTVNLYWIFPNIYFVLNHAKEVPHANINRLFSEQAFLKNKEFGNLNDIFLLKSFFFDWNIYQGKNVFTDLLLPWINHFKDIKVLMIAYGFSFSFFVGAFYFIKKHKLKTIPVFSLLLVSLFFLINDNFPISFVFNFFQSHIPLFKEALRFPDDKILNEYVFIVSIFFGYFCLFAINYLKRIKLKIKSPELIFAFIIAVLIFYYSLPSFMGNYINYYMRVSIPNEYFKVFDYLKTQPDNVRVANLPIQSPWGWVYYNWYDNKPSYQGAGFLYFGIKQPLLDRDFDRWSPYNESYYREMSYAIYSQNKELLANVLRKYNIGFILLDRNVSDPQNLKSVLYFDESKKLIEETNLLDKEIPFGKIEIFKLKIGNNNISSSDLNVNVLPETTTTYQDLAYSFYKGYISTNEKNNLTPVIYPFRDLIDNQSRLHGNILTLDNEKITLTPSSRISDFQTGNLSQDFNLIPSDVLANRNSNQLSISIYPNTPVFETTPSTVPIKGVIDIGSAKINLALSVNENELFDLGVLPENTPISIGKILLKNADNTISAFDTSLVTPVLDTVKIINPFFSSCKNDNNLPVAGFTENGISVSGKGDVCILIPYDFFPKDINGQIANLLINFQFSFSGDAKISSCLFSQETSTCLYYRNPIRKDDLVSFPYVLASDQAGKKAIKIFIEPGNGNNNKYLLSNLTTWYSKSVVDLKLSKAFISSIFIDKQNVSFDKIYLPKSIIYDPGFTITKVNKFENDCKAATSESSKQIVNVNGIDTIKYLSKNGSFCDHFSYVNLPHNQGYLVVVNSKNKSGLPLTLCVTDYTSRKCDIYSDLTSFNSFGQDVFLLPPMDKNGIGYDINLENLGINKSPSENYLSSLEFIPIPYEFLQNIKSKDNLVNTPKEIANQQIKINPLFYLVKTNSTPSVISLNNSYEPGFRAYYTDCFEGISCGFKAFFAPFFGKEIKNHVLVDNWANGWIVNGNNIAIIFIPQYLEYLGFVLILFTSVYLGLRLKSKN